MVGLYRREPLYGLLLISIELILLKAHDDWWKIIDHLFSSKVCTAPSRKWVSQIRKFDVICIPDG